MDDLTEAVTAELLSAFNVSASGQSVFLEQFFQIAASLNVTLSSNITVDTEETLEQIKCCLDLEIIVVATHPPTAAPSVSPSSSFPSFAPTATTTSAPTAVEGEDDDEDTGGAGDGSSGNETGQVVIISAVAGGVFVVVAVSAWLVTRRRKRLRHTKSNIELLGSASGGGQPPRLSLSGVGFVSFVKVVFQTEATGIVLGDNGAGRVEVVAVQDPSEAKTNGAFIDSVGRLVPCGPRT